MEVLRVLNKGQSQPVFEAMRMEFPFLAESTASYALGEVWGREVLDPETHQLSTMAAFASLGLRGFFKTHAGYKGNCIWYLDDTGFTADGKFQGDVFHHGGYVFRRVPQVAQAGN